MSDPCASESAERVSNDEEDSARRGRRQRFRVSIELLGVIIALFAAGVSTYQAWDASKSANAQAEIARRAAADQVVLVGDTKDANSTSFGVFAETPTRVQNYGRLPVSRVVIQVDLAYLDRRVTTYMVPLGPLTSCEEVTIVDHGSLYKEGHLKDLKGVNLLIHYTDAAGYAWQRGVSGPPRPDSDPLPKGNGPIGVTGHFDRSSPQSMKRCSPS